MFETGRRDRRRPSRRTAALESWPSGLRAFNGTLWFEATALM